MLLLNRNICRICLGNDNIQDIFVRKENEISLVEKILSCINLVVTETDNFPRKLCFACRQQLDTAYALRTRSASTEERLQRILKLLKDKQQLLRPPDLSQPTPAAPTPGDSQELEDCLKSGILLHPSVGRHIARKRKAPVPKRIRYEDMEHVLQNPVEQRLLCSDTITAVELLMNVAADDQPKNSKPKPAEEETASSKESAEEDETKSQTNRKRNAGRKKRMTAQREQILEQARERKMSKKKKEENPMELHAKELKISKDLKERYACLQAEYSELHEKMTLERKRKIPGEDEAAEEAPKKKRGRPRKTDTSPVKNLKVLKCKKCNKPVANLRMLTLHKCHHGKEADEVVPAESAELDREVIQTDLKSFEDIVQGLVRTNQENVDKENVAQSVSAEDSREKRKKMLSKKLLDTVEVFQQKKQKKATAIETSPKSKEEERSAKSKVELSPKSKEEAEGRSPKSKEGLSSTSTGKEKRSPKSKEEPSDKYKSPTSKEEGPSSKYKEEEVRSPKSKEGPSSKSTQEEETLVKNSKLDNDVSESKSEEKQKDLPLKDPEKSASDLNQSDSTGTKENKDVHPKEDAERLNCEIKPQDVSAVTHKPKRTMLVNFSKLSELPSNHEMTDSLKSAKVPSYNSLGKDKSATVSSSTSPEKLKSSKVSSDDPSEKGRSAKVSRDDASEEDPKPAAGKENGAEIVNSCQENISDREISIPVEQKIGEDVPKVSEVLSSDGEDAQIEHEGGTEDPKIIEVLSSDDETAEAPDPNPASIKTGPIVMQQKVSKSCSPKKSQTCKGDSDGKRENLPKERKKAETELLKALELNPASIHAQQKVLKASSPKRSQTCKADNYSIRKNLQNERKEAETEKAPELNPASLHAQQKVSKTLSPKQSQTCKADNDSKRENHPKDRKKAEIELLKALELKPTSIHAQQKVSKTSSPKQSQSCKPDNDSKRENLPNERKKSETEKAPELNPASIQTVPIHAQQKVSKTSSPKQSQTCKADNDSKRDNLPKERKKTEKAPGPNPASTQALPVVDTQQKLSKASSPKADNGSKRENHPKEKTKPETVVSASVKKLIKPTVVITHEKKPEPVQKEKRRTVGRPKVLQQIERTRNSPNCGPKIEPGRIMCDQCGKKFETRYVLIQHLQEHLIEDLRGSL